MEKIFRVETTTYLAAERFGWLFQQFLALKGYPRDWGDTMKSMRENKVLHRYLRNDSRFKGKQVIYCFEVNGKFIVVLTTFDPVAGAAKRTGNGWVLLIDPRAKRPFFSFPLRRTRGFIKRILAVTKIFIAIAQYWPRCPECGEEMFLVREGPILMRAFQCLSKEPHQKIRRKIRITRMLLPEKYLQALQDRFEQYYLYRFNEYQEGNDRQYAVVIRSQRIEEKDYGLPDSHVNLENHYDTYDDTRYENLPNLYIDEAPDD